MKTIECPFCNKRFEPEPEPDTRLAAAVEEVAKEMDWYVGNVTYGSVISGWQAKLRAAGRKT